MAMVVEFSPTEEEFIHAQAVAANLSAELFARDAILKAARKAAYIAKLEESDRQIKEGKVKKFTSEEWEKFVNEQNV